MVLVVATWLQGQDWGKEDTAQEGWLAGRRGAEPSQVSPVVSMPKGLRGWVGGLFLGLWCRRQGFFCLLKQVKWVMDRALA